MENRSLIIEKDLKIAIPESIRKHLNIKPGDIIEFTLENIRDLDGELRDNVIMIKKPV